MNELFAIDKTRPIALFPFYRDQDRRPFYPRLAPLLVESLDVPAFLVAFRSVLCAVAADTARMTLSDARATLSSPDSFAAVLNNLCSSKFRTEFANWAAQDIDGITILGSKQPPEAACSFATAFHRRSI